MDEEGNYFARRLDSDSEDTVQDESEAESPNKEADLLGLNNSKLSAIEKPADSSVHGALIDKMK